MDHNPSEILKNLVTKFFRHETSITSLLDVNSEFARNTVATNLLSVVYNNEFQIHNICKQIGIILHFLAEKNKKL